MLTVHQGNTNYYGYHKLIDTTQPFTVVTQFKTDDGTSKGNLNAIVRKYVQHGIVYENQPQTYGASNGSSVNTTAIDVSDGQSNPLHI